MLGLLVAALMAASFFMPWINMFGQEIGPQMFLEEGAPDLMELPWQAMAFLASFPLAGLAALLIVLQLRSGLIMLVAGAIPFGLIAYQVSAAKGQLSELGMPQLEFDLSRSSEAIDVLSEVLKFGAPIYAVSAALLVFLGLVRLVQGR